MDGDNKRRKQHDGSAYSSRLGTGHRSISRASRGNTDRFRQSGLQPTRGDLTALPQPRRTSRIPSYADYGYTEQQSYGNTLFQSGPLQGEELQTYHQDFAGTQQTHQRDQGQPPPQQPQQFAPYDAEIVYNLGPQGQGQSPYDVVPQCQTRQSAAIEAMSSHFAVPQYFSPGEPTGTGVPAVIPPYLTPQVHSSPYNHPGPIGRSSAVQPFPATMADFTPVGTTGRLEQQQQPAPDVTNLDEAYAQFQRALRGTFDDTRAGRLIEASRSLLEISEWLVTNARELGILRDDQLLHSDRLQLWNDFNICWLSVCQRQKDMTQDLLDTGHQAPNTNLLDVAAMENLGTQLIQLCDKLEQHGLVDYQMGIWEEEILCVLGQCLDLVENRPGLLGPPTVAGETTAPAAASRS